MSTSDRTTPLAGEYEMNQMPGQRAQVEGVNSQGVRSRRSPTLQERVQETVNSAGQMDVNQITALVDHETKMQNEYSRMRHLIAAIGLMMLIFGVVSAVVVKHMIESHKTTSTHDGTLVSANGEQVVATAAATRQAPLSSFLSDAALRELKVLALTGDNEASVHMNILGFVRLPKQACRHSLVKLFTAAGVLLLDGEKLSFDTGVSHVIAEAGFDHVINTRNQDGDAGRHLLATGLAEMIGMFNFVGKFTDDGTFRALPNDACEDMALTNFAGVPDAFKMTAVGYIACKMPLSMMTAAEERVWCLANKAVPHPKATATTLTGLYFTQKLVLKHDRAAQRSIISRVSSWDPLQRTELQVEDEATSMLKSAMLTVDGELHNCKVGQLPADGSIFDSAVPESAQLLNIDGDSVWSVKVKTYMSELRLHDGKLAVDLELRIWTDSTGAWTRFQVFDAVAAMDAAEAASAAAALTAEVVDGSKTINVVVPWTDQEFFDVEEMLDVATSKTDVFDKDTFNLDFTGRHKNCADNVLAPLDRHPSHPSSDAYLLWRASAVDDTHAGEREVEYDPNNFEQDAEDETSPQTRRLLSAASAQVDRTQLVDALSSYTDDAATVDRLADGVQEQIDAAVLRALHAYESGEEQPMPTLKRAHTRRAVLAADEDATLSPASRALMGRRDSKCYNADWWAARLKFNACYHKNTSVDMSLKWNVVAPNVPVVGVSIAANVDLVYKKEANKPRPLVKPSGCVQFTIGADALPSIVNKGCSSMGIECTFELAKICINYDSDLKAITGMASVGPSRLQVAFKILIPVQRNSINNVKGWVTTDLYVWSKDFDLVDYDF